MNAKFEMILGVNLAVAAALMQGCKAPNARLAHQDEAAPVAEAQPAPATQDVTVAPIEGAKTEAPAPAPVPAKEVVKPLPPPPAPAEEYTVYTIQRGDMLSKICHRYGVKLNAVLKLNPGLNPNRLYVGRTIKLPGVLEIAAPASAPAGKEKSAKPAKKGAKAEVKAAPATAANVKAPSVKTAPAAKYTGATKEYVVKSGDQLGKIAYANGITIRALKEMNGLKDNHLKIGQKLKVPAEKVKAPEKKVEKAKVAEKKEEAKAAEKPVEAVAPVKAEAEPAASPAPAKTADETAAPATPAPAATTSAPAPAPATETYTVKPNEDLVTIAINFGVSPSALQDLNNLKPEDSVKPGQVLKIPAGAKAQ